METSHLQQQRDRSKGIVPGVSLNSDYSAIPGWTVKRTDSSFRGQKSLCEDLQCSSITDNPNTFSTEVSLSNQQQQQQQHSNPMSDYYQDKLFDLQTNNQNCRNENKILSERISQNLETCNDKLEKCFDRTYAPVTENNYQSYSRLQEPATTHKTDHDRHDRINYERYNTADWDHIRLLGNGSFMSQFLNLIFLPLTVCDKMAPCYKGRPPVWFMRYIYAFVLATMYLLVALTIFSLVAYSLKFLPEPPRRPRQRLEEKDVISFNKQQNKNFFRRSKNRIEEQHEPEPVFSLNIADLLQGVLKLSRGGGSTLDSLTPFQKNQILNSIDPIFVLVRLEKCRQECETLRRKEKTKNNLFRNINISVRFKKLKLLHRTKLLGYGLIGIITLSSSSSTTTVQTRIQQRTEDKIYTKARPEDLKDTQQTEVEASSSSSRKIKLGGGKIITFKSELIPENKLIELEENTDPTRINFSEFKKNRYKTRRLADLPPLLDSDFMEVIQESEKIDKIKIDKTKIE